MFAGGINMDYIREELLRQNRILTRLMVGEDSQNERDAPEQDRRVFSAEKETAARTRWSGAAVEALTAAGIAVAETGGDKSRRMQRKTESDSGETERNSFMPFGRIRKNGEKPRISGRCPDRSRETPDGMTAVFRFTERRGQRAVDAHAIQGLHMAS